MPSAGNSSFPGLLIFTVTWVVASGNPARVRRLRTFAWPHPRCSPMRCIGCARLHAHARFSLAEPRPYCRRRPLGGSFPDDVARRLVVAQAEVAGMPQAPVARPLGEADLGHQLGLYPVRAAWNRMHVGEGTVGALE